MPPLASAVNVPLYLDWSFWAVVVAALALVLSQLPPIAQMVRSARVTLELHSRISVSQKIGNPNIQLHVILTNTGGRTVPVRGIKIRIKRDGKDVATIPAQGFLQEPGDKNAVLFTGFRLSSKEEWGHIVNFFDFFGRADEKKYRASELALRTNIVERRTLPENKDKIVDADPKHVTPLQEIFDLKFIWQAGEYELTILVESRKADILAEKRYRFTLFESDSTELASARTDLKSGDGTFWDSGNHPGVIVQIVEA